MKRLMVLLGVAAFAAGVQAASLNWAISSIANSSDSSTKGSGYLAYLFITEQSGYFGAATTTAAAATEALTGGTFASYVSSYAAGNPGTVTALGMVSGATGYNGSNFAAGDSLSAFAVIIDSNSIDSFNNYIITDVKSVSWTSGTGSKALGFGSQASATYQPASVPEPTSGLLMLCGLAGLALRRKRA